LLVSIEMTKARRQAESACWRNLVLS